MVKSGTRCGAIATLTSVVLAACAAPPATVAVADADLACEVTVTYGSECCGVDRTLERRVSAYVAAEPLVLGRSEMSWGREGERTLCLAVAPESTPDVFDRIKRLMTEVPESGWTELTSGEAVFRTEPKPR